MAGRVLLMDNQQDVLDKWGKLLEGDGYSVLRAATLAEAEELLSHAWIQLAILDIRMVDENDENDISGLLLAKKPEFEPVPKIILTAFPSYEYVREVLAPDARGQRPALNFIAKSEGPQALRQAVQRAFDEQIRVNWDLGIQWDEREHLSFFHLASILQADLHAEDLVSRASELEDIFRRLFYDYQQIRIDRLFWHDGRRFCLPVLAQTRQGALALRVLVCGRQEMIGREFQYRQEPASKAGRDTELVAMTETVHFGAITYVLGVETETAHTLRHLFQSGRERPLRKAFDHLLQEPLSAWHQRGQTVEQERDLMSLYRARVGLEASTISRPEVNRRVDALIQSVRPLSAVEIERTGGQVVFRFPAQPPLACPDPVQAVYATLERYGESVVCKISPGQLTADNVLVDAGQQTWLTDFGSIGQAPQWWDYVCLEAIVRFDLSQAPDLLAWLEFEECLTAPAGLQDRLPEQDVIADLRTSVALIEQIRRQAGSETGADIAPYYAGLLAWAMGAVARYDPSALYTRAEQMHNAHLLLAAALIARRLQDPLANTPVEGALRLEEDGKVWIGEHCVATLAGQELDLLRCLLEKSSQVLTRRAIVESVFGEEYSALEAFQEDTRINTLVGRLRKDIEPDPGRPRYVQTVRGKGYRLSVTGAPDG